MAIALLLVASVYFPRGLLYDGSFYFSNVLTTKTFFLLERSRLFAQYLVQVPTVLAIWAGETSLNTLIRIHSLGLVIALAMWAYALYLHMRSGLFWLFAWAFSVSYLFVCFSVIGEHNVGLAATALSMAILLKDEKIGLFDGLLLLATAVLLVRSYETAIFLNVLLLAVALFRAKSQESRWTTCLLLVCSVAYLLGVGFAAISIAYPRDPANLKGAANFGWMVRDLKIQYLVWSGASIVGLLFIRSRPFQIAIILVFALFSLYLVSSPIAWNKVIEYMNARALAGLALFSSLGIIFILRLLDLKPNRFANFVCGVVFVVMMVPFGFALDRYQKHSRCYERAVERLTGVVELEQSGVMNCRHFREFDIKWTNTNLSILYRAPGSSAVTTNEKGWTYYNPVNPHLVSPDMLGVFRKTGPIF